MTNIVESFVLNIECEHINCATKIPSSSNASAACQQSEGPLSHKTYQWRIQFSF